MGYTTNVALSIPMGIIIYMLTEKLIINTGSEQDFDERVQSNFIVGFVTGLTFIALAMTIFAAHGQLDNQSLQYAMYGAGGFLVLNSVFFSWDLLDDSTKMMILGISISGMIIWSYTQRRGGGKARKKSVVKSGAKRGTKSAKK